MELIEPVDDSTTWVHVFDYHFSLASLGSLELKAEPKSTTKMYQLLPVGYFPDHKFTIDYQSALGFCFYSLAYTQVNLDLGNKTLGLLYAKRFKLFRWDFQRSLGLSRGFSW